MFSIRQTALQTAFSEDLKVSLISENQKYLNVKIVAKLDIWTLKLFTLIFSFIVQHAHQWVL